MSQLICRDVSLGYDGQTVCEQISFTVEAGDCLCIVGDNGSGKSTLMRTLLNLKTPSSGEILFGEGIHQKEIGYLPQQNEAQKDFPASVFEVVLSGCVTKEKFRFFPSKGSRKSAGAALHQMGLFDLRKRPFRTLSGGQQQRVLLARALCATQKILVLDEPAVGLDPQATERMYDTIRHLNRAHGITVIMVTHDLSAVVRLATRVLHMSRRPTFYHSVEDYRASTDFPRRKEASDEHSAD